MQEIVVSQKRKINTGNYQSIDIMISLKKQILDTGETDLEPQINKLFEEMEFILDKKEKEIRKKIEERAKE